MATYIEKFGGYIADNPNIEFEVCGKDGKSVVYSYDEVNTASMTNNSESIEITGGQGNFPLAVLDTTKTLEFTFESSEFTLDMFAMANDVKPIKASDYVGGSYYVRTSKRFDVDNDLSITIDDIVDDTSIYINGFEAATAPAAGQYMITTEGGTPGDDTNSLQKIMQAASTALTKAKADESTAYTNYINALKTEDGTEDDATTLAAYSKAVADRQAAQVAYAEAVKNYNASITGGNKVKITFSDADMDKGDTVRVSYLRKVNDDSHIASILTTSHTVKGQLTATWPVYSSGTSCDDAAIKAYVHVFMPLVRATALPGFDSSYKTAMTQSITFTALDPKRGDKKMFDVIWEENHED